MGIFRKNKEVEELDHMIQALEQKMLALDEEGNPKEVSTDDIEKYQKLVQLKIALLDSQTTRKTKKKDSFWSRLWSGIGTIGTLATGIGGLYLYGTYLDKGFEFEKEGTYTSKTFLDLIRRGPRKP